MIGSSFPAHLNHFLNEEADMCEEREQARERLFEDPDTFKTFMRDFADYVGATDTLFKLIQTDSASVGPFIRDMYRQHCYIVEGQS